MRYVSNIDLNQWFSDFGLRKIFSGGFVNNQKEFTMSAEWEFHVQRFLYRKQGFRKLIGKIKDLDIRNL